MRRFIFLAVLLLIFCFGTAFGRYQVGETVENFTLPDSAGNLVSLSDYSDRIVAIYFWAFD